MQIANSIDACQLMSETKFYEAYSRWNEDENRFETWSEFVD